MAGTPFAGARGYGVLTTTPPKYSASWVTQGMSMREGGEESGEGRQTRHHTFHIQSNPHLRCTLRGYREQEKEIEENEREPAQNVIS